MDRGSQFVQPALALIVAVAAAWVTAFAVERVVRRNMRRSAATVWSSLKTHCKLPFRITLIIAALLLALPYAGHGGIVLPIGRPVPVLPLVPPRPWVLLPLSPRFSTAPPP